MAETPVPLYRRGKANSPLMDNVRDRDVTRLDYNDDEEWVKADSNGISTFASSKSGQNWWRVDAGVSIPDGISLINDHDDHWLWQPKYNMRLSEYQELLRQVSIYFVKLN